MTSHIRLFEDGRVIGVDGRAWSAAPVNAWAGLPLEIHPHMTKRDVYRRSNPSPLLFARFGARGSCRIVSARTHHDLALAPGQIDLFAADFPMDHGAWDCTPGEIVGIELSASCLRALSGDDDPLPPLATALSVDDPALLRLIARMRAEVDGGCRTGQLYADGLSLALVAHLASRYRRRAPARPTCHAVLSLADRRRVTDFIEAELGSELRVAQLAALVGMSTGWFTEAFHRTFGATPHRFVTGRRILAAQRLLAGDLPLVRIAYELGFASQAHFTAAFRKQVGATPARARASHRANGAGTDEPGNGVF